MPKKLGIGSGLHGKSVLYLRYILGLVHTSYLVEEMDGTLEIVHYGEECTFPSSGKTSQCLLKSEGGKYSTLSNGNTFSAPTLVK